MNQRIVDMIKFLNQSEKTICLKDLASRYQVSERTIRNDINSINEILEEEGLSSILLGSNGTLILAEDFSDAEEYTAGQDFYSYKLSRQERKVVIAVFLVNTVEYITLATIAEHLFVSRATIINDLDGVKEFLQNEGNLEVISHPNRGLRVNGLESSKRKFLMRISDAGFMGMHGVGYTERLLGIKSGNAVTVRKIIQEQEQVYGCHLTDESYHQMELYLRIMIQRTDTGNFIENREHEDNSKYRMAQDILKYITQYCKNQSTEDEVEYLSTLLEQCHYLKQTSSEMDVIRTQLLTRQFIEAVSEELEMNLNDDYDFYENLSNHLDSIFSRRNTVYPENPVLDEVIVNNQEVFTSAKKHIKLLENHIGRTISEIELSYIVIHICAALERKKNKELSLRIILACSGGIGTSQLLLAKLKRHFNFHIVDIMAAHEAAGLEEEDADLIITTVPLKDSLIPYVQVTPMLNDEDYVRVGSQIDVIRNSRSIPVRPQEKELTARAFELLKPVIYQYAGEEAGEYDAGEKDGKEYFNRNEPADDIFNPQLHQLLFPEYIELDGNARTGKGDSKSC